MRSLLVFFLWIITCLIGVFVLFPTWLFLITVPRMFWHVYRKSSELDQHEWEMPWFPTSWMVDMVRRLDPKNKIDKTKTDAKAWVAGSG